MKVLLLAAALVLGAARAPALPTMSIDNVSAPEGNSGSKSFVFTVTLSAPAPAGGVQVSYDTSDGTALATSDYTPVVGGLLSIPAGNTSGTISITVFGDTVPEADETFFVTLSSPVNATILDGIGVGTILNDDGMPEVSISGASQAEGNSGTSNLNFTVSLSFLSGADVTVHYRTVDGSATVANGDYVAQPAGVLVIPAGDSSGVISVVINGDTTVEPHETFQVELESATNATVSATAGIGTGTIQNDDSNGGGAGSCGALGLELLLPLVLAAALRRRRS